MSKYLKFLSVLFVIAAAQTFAATTTITSTANNTLVGTVDDATNTGSINSTRLGSGAYPKLRLAGQGGMEFAVDINTVRMAIDTAGKVGIGTTAPTDKLDVRGGLVLDNGGNPELFASATGASQMGRYLHLLNSTAFRTASGLKAGGLLVADNYAYANPSLNDLIVKGNVGIGTSSPSCALTVIGTISAKEVRVTANGYPDYVFAKDYKLAKLSDVEKYIDENKHLPGIPSAAEIEKNGLGLSEMSKKQMEKIEELTLYMIELKKENEALKKRIEVIETSAAKTK